MGKIFIVLALFFSSDNLFSQSHIRFFEYILSENYEGISSSFGRQVDVCILSYEGLLGRQEAVAKLKGFLSKNKPMQYTIKHKGTSKDNQSTYYVADLHTQNGTFRLFVHISEKNGNLLVSEFRIERN